jgi:DNA gyrase subunit A
VLTDGKQDLLLSTFKGKAIRFRETDVRAMGRTATGVKGISLTKDDRVKSLWMWCTMNHDSFGH